MKKIFFVCFIIVLGLIFVSCDLGKSVSGPRDTWCKRTITVQGVEIDCYLLYTENGYENSQLNSEAFTGSKIEPGLTVVLNPITDGFIGDLTSSCYTKKYFPLGESKVNANPNVDGTDTEAKSITVNNLLWNSIWICNSATFTANELSTNPPPLLRGNGGLNFIDKVEDLSWKQVLIAILEGI